MKTEDLIKALAADSIPEPGTPRSALSALPFALLVALFLLWITLGFRADLGAAILTPISAMRFVLSLGLGVAGLGLVLALSRPHGISRRWQMLAGSVVAIALILWGANWLATPSDAVGMAVRGKTLVVCLVTIPVLSVLPAVVLFRALRNGATTRPSLAGAGVGMASGGFAAALYAMHCTEDNPLFYVTWYGVGILAVTIISSLLGQKLLRW